LAGARIVVLGLAFKPDTGDTRESPAIPIISLLLGAGAKVVAHDPVVTESGVLDLVAAGLSLENDLKEAVSEAEAVVLVTRWNDYLELPRLVASIDREPLIVDGRRMFDPRAFARYRGIGL
jgi:UDPglucose 6-dehydrogenase